MNHTRGFTLIELLVVVLIIGILSAIALPQYTLAVEKSRMAEALRIAASLRHAVDIYVMENGYQSVELVGDRDNNGISGKLSVDVESILDCTQDGGDVCGSKYFTYDAYCETSQCVIRIERKRDGKHDNDVQYGLRWDKDKSTGQWSAFCGETNEGFPYSEKLCSQLWGQGWSTY